MIFDRLVREHTDDTPLFNALARSSRYRWFMARVIALPTWWPFS